MDSPRSNNSNSVADKKSLKRYLAILSVSHLMMLFFADFCLFRSKMLVSFEVLLFLLSLSAMITLRINLLQIYVLITVFMPFISGYLLYSKELERSQRNQTVIGCQDVFYYVFGCLGLIRLTNKYIKTNEVGGEKDDDDFELVSKSRLDEMLRNKRSQTAFCRKQTILEAFNSKSHG